MDEIFPQEAITMYSFLKSVLRRDHMKTQKDVGTYGPREE